MVCNSEYSTPVMYTTAVAAPSQPDPPMLSEQFVTALTVSWIRRPGDDFFTLHMDDESKVRPAFLFNTFYMPVLRPSVFSMLQHSLLICPSVCLSVCHHFWFLEDN